MNTDTISLLFEKHLHQLPKSIKRCAVGIGNQVYVVECGNNNYIFRCSEENNAYENTIYWLNELAAIDIPIPKVLFHGKHETYWYLVLNYIEGEDIGLVYSDLTKEEKKNIAEDVMEIQRKVSGLQIKHSKNDWSWKSVLDELLDRADLRITQNGYFHSEKVTQLKDKMYLLDEYFSNVKPVAYLDDISTKNLLILNGQVSGVIDIDWMGEGDNLTFIAMTYIALKNMDCETDYVEFLLEKRGCTELEKKAFLFYSLMFCVDFMGERGMQFGDKVIEVNENVIYRLNRIYDDLWEEFLQAAF
ncbi:MAG: phosphotransferase [Lachnospiraceae bacterium]|nr:phosphotransferase [Lachnospiraceae bacterium]